MTENQTVEETISSNENATTPSSSDWWKGIFDVARIKSAEVFEFVKKDLDELSSTVKTEATNVVNSTKSVFKETLQLDKPESTASNMKKSVSTFLDQVSNVLSPSPEDEDEEAVMIQGSDVVPLTRLQTQIYNLGSDSGTFLRDIEPELLPRYEAWLEVVEGNENKQLSNEKLIKMLVNNPQLQTNYETLVPNKISHALFWNRYLFRKAIIEDEEAKLERKAKKDKDGDNEDDDKEDTVWGKEEDEFNYNVELSEEDQIKLLEDYEREKQLNKLQKEKDAKAIEEKSPKKDVKKNSDSNQMMNMREKKDMIIVGDLPKSTTSSTYSSKGSTEEDWEKEINMDDVEAEVPS